jgi:recombination protein RecT
MAENENNNNGEGSKKGAAALATLNDAATLVATYAARLLNDKRSQQFYAQISLMAKQEPKIAMCTPESVLSSMMACVHLDLMPNTPEQHAFVIPYKNNRLGIMQLQFQIGYKGMLVLAERSGQVRKIEAELVFEGDRFTYALGLARKLNHRPSMDVDRTDYKLVKAAYAVITLRNGEQVFDVMGRKELDKIQATAKASADDAPWKKWPEAMAKKTIVKRALKLVPSSSEDNRLEYAASIDSWAQVGKLKVDEEGRLLQAANEAASNKADAADVKQKAKDILANLDKNETTESDNPHKNPAPAEPPTDDK